MENNYSKYNKIPKYRQKHPYYENRELSWLKFNERILDEARNVKVPLCERMSFASIFQKNLDEFYMIRDRNARFAANRSAFLFIQI